MLYSEKMAIKFDAQLWRRYGVMIGELLVAEDGEHARAA